MDILSYKLGKASGGGGGGLDWTAIGFSGTPQSIVNGYNYAKKIQDEYNNSKSYMNDRNIIIFPYVDSSSRYACGTMFQNCEALIELALFDTSNVTNFASMFNGCKALKKIPQFDTSNVDSFSMTFYGCKSLVDVPILNTAKATSLQWTFDSCQSLSDDSLNNIMRMCINATKITSNKTLSYIGISSTQATIKSFF